MKKKSKSFRRDIRSDTNVTLFTKFTGRFRLQVNYVLFETHIQNTTGDTTPIPSCSVIWYQRNPFEFYKKQPKEHSLNEKFNNETYSTYVSRKLHCFPSIADSLNRMITSRPTTENSTSDHFEKVSILVE